MGEGYRKYTVPKKAMVIIMVKKLVHDPMFLAMRSERATAEDVDTATDLLDTLRAHSEDCVGMAANMIGVRRCIICFADGKDYTAMLNPEIIKKSEPYEAEEGCLSLLGGARPVKRYKTVKVKYQTLQLETRVKNYTGWTAQIIQHEIDHCNGVLI